MVRNVRDITELQITDPSPKEGYFSYATCTVSSILADMLVRRHVRNSIDCGLFVEFPWS